MRDIQLAFIDLNTEIYWYQYRYNVKLKEVALSCDITTSLPFHY